jgi:ribose 5-phosphate isomerase B
MIYIASDHGGLSLKQKVVKHLSLKKVMYQDLGPFKLDPQDDYPDFAKQVASAVAKNPETHIGILLCRSGQGMCVAANKIKGIRAVSAWNKELAFSTRNDDFGNVLCLASDHIKPSDALKIADVFIKTPFSKSARHGRRINKIKQMEK